VHALPEAESPSDGVLFNKVSPLQDKDRLAALMALPPKEERPEGWYVVTATRQGLIKKSSISDLPGPAAKTFTLVKVNDDDQLGWVALSNGQADILLATADGMAIRFSEDDVRPMGLVAAGVGGIKLGARDEIIGMEIISEPLEILLVTSDGKSKRVPGEQFPRQGRYGQGVMTWKLARTEQLVGMMCGKPTSRVTLHLDKLASKAIRFDDAPLQTRSSSGKRVIDLKPGDRIIYLTILAEAAGSAPDKPARKSIRRTAPETQEEAVKPTKTRITKSPSTALPASTQSKGRAKRASKPLAVETAPKASRTPAEPAVKKTPSKGSSSRTKIPKETQPPAGKPEPTSKPTTSRTTKRNSTK
jgi:DNA gyrase subunit A